MSSVIDELQEAQDEATAALRSNDPGWQKAAAERLQTVAERVGMIGGLFILMALEHAGLPVQKKLAAVFNGLAQGAWQKASQALAKAGWVADELQSVRERLETLEARSVQEDTPEPDRAADDAVACVMGQEWVSFPFPLVELVEE